MFNIHDKNSRNVNDSINRNIYLNECNDNYRFDTLNPNGHGENIIHFQYRSRTHSNTSQSNQSDAAILDNVININSSISYEDNNNDSFDDKDFDLLYRQFEQFEKEQSTDLMYQLAEVKSITHKIYETVKESVQHKNISQSRKTSKQKWPEGTCLIIGSSTISGLQEKRMSGKFKVRPHPGATISDIYHHVIPMVEKKKNIRGYNDWY